MLVAFSIGTIPGWPHALGAGSDYPPKLAQQAAHQVDQRRAPGLELLADAVQCLHALGVGT